MTTKATQIRATLLSPFFEPKAKKFLTTPEIKKAIQCPHRDIGSRLWGLHNDGYLVKKGGPTRSGVDAKLNFYGVSPKGRKFFQDNKTCVVNDPDAFLKLLTDKKPRNVSRSKEAIQPRAYSPSALNAIEGISELIDNNEKLLATLRLVYRHLGNALNQYDKKQTVQMPAVEKIEVEVKV